MSANMANAYFYFGYYYFLHAKSNSDLCCRKISNTLTYHYRTESHSVRYFFRR